MNEQWDGAALSALGRLCPTILTCTWPHTGLRCPHSLQWPSPHTSPKSDVESGLTMPWAAMSSQSIWKVIQRKPSITAPQTRLFPPPGKMPTLAAKPRCVAQRRGGRRIDKSLNSKIFFIEDGRSGDSGGGGTGVIKVDKQLRRGHHLCSLIRISFLELHFDVIICIFSALWNLRTFWPKTTRSQPSFHFGDGVRAISLCLPAIWWVCGRDSNSVDAHSQSEGKDN